MIDFLKFKKMLTPVIIQLIFWISIVAVVITGFAGIARGLTADYGGGSVVFIGILWLLLGPIVIRVYCEILIVIFSINDTLTEVKNLLKNKEI